MKQKKLNELLSKIPSMSEDSEGMLRGGFAAISGNIPQGSDTTINILCSRNAKCTNNCGCTTTQKPSGTSSSSKGMNFFQFF